MDKHRALALLLLMVVAGFSGVSAGEPQGYFVAGAGAYESHVWSKRLHFQNLPVSGLSQSAESNLFIGIEISRTEPYSRWDTASDLLTGRTRWSGQFGHYFMENAALYGIAQYEHSTGNRNADADRIPPGERFGIGVDWAISPSSRLRAEYAAPTRAWRDLGGNSQGFGAGGDWREDSHLEIGFGYRF
ncbi:hypothetical protein [Thioalkalivibrio sp. ALE16]|uniref:hypothetical protein n=1 Tax=Thioalkalivibrio sp. ALE16 TaxID=1158172 RepID=UPI0012DDA1BD|nr:hypothetical protein [Thioalkalivibrio sp. ALE16]